MTLLRRSRRCAARIAALAAAAACFAGPPSSAGATTTKRAADLAMVTFGDSVASGTHCGCTPFPAQYAAKVAARTGARVRMTNYAVAGFTSSNVMKQLHTTAVQATVRRAGTALVMIGANDFSAAFSRVLSGNQRATAAFPPVAAAVRRTVTAEIQLLKQLHPGIHVIVAGYWNVMKDGQVGVRTYGTLGEKQALAATSAANTALYTAAHDTRSSYVSTFRPFKGPDGRTDCTRLLAPDGDHPNAAGHFAIARALFAAAPRG